MYFTENFIENMSWLIPSRSGVCKNNFQSCSNIKVPPILMPCVEKCNNDLESFIWQPLQYCFGWHDPMQDTKQSNK